MANQLLFAFIISVVIVGLAYWRNSLSRSGAVGALLVGFLTFGFGGWQWGVLLGIFFVSSSLLSHYKESEKKIASEKFDKGHRRDFGQVMANGGLGAVVALLSSLLVSPIWLLLFVGIMATVTADTWATELGTLSKRPPRLITTGRVVEVGTSGGVSLLGTAVSASGGFLIGITAGLLTNQSLWLFAVLGMGGGLAGSLFDSLLGATVQRVYYCEIRQRETEKKLNPLGEPNNPIRGWAWMNNDLVNLAASLIGGVIAVLLFLLWG
ncbi:MAG: DUF92 domain-containing protein [Anaerolineales bacterium]|nr:DUF92 domain-containing protein [Anaerolineales bacterium]MCA9928404.1 DUF92 domain-containing protein [Anaerolineales bacterium]